MWNLCSTTYCHGKEAKQREIRAAWSGNATCKDMMNHFMWPDKFNDWWLINWLNSQKNRWAFLFIALQNSHQLAFASSLLQQSDAILHIVLIDHPLWGGQKEQNNPYPVSSPPSYLFFSFSVWFHILHLCSHISVGSEFVHPPLMGKWPSLWTLIGSVHWINASEPTDKHNCSKQI